MSVRLEDLEKRLWDAANALRGPVDPADFKTYVFPVLFWKWISDTWDWEHAKAVADYGDNVDPVVEADYHKFELPVGTHWRDVTTKTANLGAQINKALSSIEQANPNSLAGIFGDAAWGNKERLPETALVNLINAFNGMTLNPDEVSHDLLGQGYEYLLKNFADESGKRAGEFFTPRQVVRLLIRILQPQPGESIYDPACGSGGMLVETINTVRDHGADTRTLRLYGQEVNLTTSAIARMNLFLHDIEDFKIVRGDTLRLPGLREADGHLSKFDVVVANPPFSLTNWGADTWAADPRSATGVPPAKNGDFAWVQHMVYSMREGTGRVGVVMPHGVLTRGAVEGRIRRSLLEQDLVEAVIGLPPDIFYSTTLPACILVIRRTKPVDRRQRVLFVDASKMFSRGRAQNMLGASDVDSIVDAFVTGASDDMAVSSVSMEEIASNQHDLNIWSYASSPGAEVAKAEDPVAEWLAGAQETASMQGIAEVNRQTLQSLLDSGEDVQTVHVPLRRLLKRKRVQVRLEPGVAYPALGVLRDGKGLFAKEPFVGGETTYSKLTVVNASDVVLRSITAWEAPVGVANASHDGFYVSGVFPVFELLSREDVEPEYLSLVFRQPWFWEEMRVRTKGSVLRRKTLSAEEFLDIVVPLPRMEVQKALAATSRAVASLADAVAAEVKAFELLAGSLGQTADSSAAQGSAE